MSTTPRYPVALVAEDGVPERIETHVDVLITIEPQDAPNYVIIDSDGNTFRVETERTGQSLFNRIINSIFGPPHSYRFVATEDKLPDHILEQAKLLLSGK